MKNYALLIIMVLVTFAGCSRKIYETAYPTLSDGKYDTEFPYRSCSRELGRISQTVRKLTAIAYYKSYMFNESQQVTVENIKNKKFKNRANREIYFNNSVIGSATVVSYVGRHIAVLTCTHIIDFEDTLYTFYTDENQLAGPYLKSVAFKERQNNFIADFPERGELEILASDKSMDIAILGRVFSSDVRFPIAVFDYPFGKARELEWGSFVYLMGYPKGYLMVTKGIVSQPDRDGQGSFLVDALFNKGFSGGIVLAIRDGVPNFEVVGMAASVSADFEYLIVPPDDIGRIGFDPRIPYEGDVFVQFNRTINYGITFIVSIENIQSFIQKNREVIAAKGYDLSHLIQ